MILGYTWYFQFFYFTIIFAKALRRLFLLFTFDSHLSASASNTRAATEVLLALTIHHEDLLWVMTEAPGR